MSLHKADRLFFETCSFNERIFYEDWQRKSGLRVFEMCAILEAHREEDERRQWEEHKAECEEEEEEESKARDQRRMIQGYLGTYLTDLLEKKADQVVHLNCPSYEIRDQLLAFVRQSDSFDEILYELWYDIFVNHKDEEVYLPKIESYAAEYFDLFVKHCLSV